MKTGIQYTPGHSRIASDFMARRTIESHGAFFVPWLARGVSVLDCGCGPGSITRGIARRVAPGNVVGVDFAASQVARAVEDTRRGDLTNVEFAVASVYELPFDGRHFDRVFSHAMMEHLADGARAIREMHRVLKPGGVAGVCSPDWSGFLVTPPSEDLDRALAAYAALQTRNGGDIHVGSKLGDYFLRAGFADLRLSAHYESAEPVALARLLAGNLEDSGDAASASVLRDWSRAETAMFAISWVECVGRKA